MCVRLCDTYASIRAQIRINNNITSPLIGECSQGDPSNTPKTLLAKILRDLKVLVPFNKILAQFGVMMTVCFVKSCSKRHI